LGKNQGIAKILVDRLKGEKHITEKLVSYPDLVKIEAISIAHNGEEKLYEAQRIFLLNKNGEAITAFT
jgi:hypothetical protein